MEIDRAEVVVIGGGVTGLSSAMWLAKEGVDVILVEKEIVGWEASGRNGGLGGYRVGESAVFPLSALSVDLWPGMDDETGYPTEFSEGGIGVALNEQDMEDMRLGQRRMRELGIETELLDASTIKELVPIVSPEVAGGTLRKKGGHANPHRAVQAYAWSLRDSGGRIYQHTMVTDVNVVAGKANPDDGIGRVVVTEELVVDVGLFPIEREPVVRVVDESREFHNVRWLPAFGGHHAC